MVYAIMTETLYYMCTYKYKWTIFVVVGSQIHITVVILPSDSYFSVFECIIVVVFVLYVQILTLLNTGIFAN